MEDYSHLSHNAPPSPDQASFRPDTNQPTTDSEKRILGEWGQIKHAFIEKRGFPARLRQVLRDADEVELGVRHKHTF